MATTQTPDALLVKNYMAGDENALAILIKRHQSKIYGFIYSKIADREITDDIFQDTFVKVIKTLKSQSYNEEGKFLPWVMRIAHNLIVDHFRKGKKKCRCFVIQKNFQYLKSYLIMLQQLKDVL